MKSYRKKNWPNILMYITTLASEKCDITGQNMCFH